MEEMRRQAGSQIRSKSNEEEDKLKTPKSMTYLHNAFELNLENNTKCESYQTDETTTNSIVLQHLHHSSLVTPVDTTQNTITSDFV